MWRPREGWAHIRSEYFEHNQSVNHWQKTRQKDYEAGADAMLEVLQEAGRISDIGKDSINEEEK